MQKYKQDYSSEWPVLKASSASITSAFSTLCRVDFSVAHGGRSDCQRHVSTKKHQDFVAASEKNTHKQISGYFTQQKDTSTINAEVLFTEFLIEHNVPIAVADHAGPLWKYCKQSLQYFQLLNGKETKKIMKHVSTRWLSLGRAISRLLEQWEPVKDFFKSELDNSKPKKKVSESASSSQPKPRSHSFTSTATSAHSSKSTAPTKPSQDFDLTSYLFKQAEVTKIAKDTADRKNEKSKANESHTRLTPSVGLRLKPVNKVE